MTKKLDIDDIRTIMEVMGNKSQSQTVVPTMQVDKDSFSSFTGGLQKGWPFILAISSIVFWLMQSIFGINSTLIAHDTRITNNTGKIIAIENKLDSIDVASNEIIRRLDNLQKDLEILKQK